MRKQQTPLQSIRAKCRDCCCGSLKAIRLCTSTNCPLHPFRFGHNPNRKGIAPNRALLRSKSAIESKKTLKKEVPNGRL